ncbi:aspartyl protease family protein [Novosphingobium aerophilum]|uniref:aspartyl protease family protein n=1 Tax=Novosphingobium TaxID=165696 RepID=UPI002D790991|nr:aspartyl protease family protein [Novosphingobium sp. RL4]WRT92675.1 aspartyl protease family protein [Novosphingobium sp. RL4]
MAASMLAKALLIAESVILGVSPPAVSGTPAPTGADPPALALRGSIKDALQDTETVQGQADIDDRMTVDVGLEGKGPYRFLIDTGSQNTVVSSTLAGRLGLVQGPEVRVISMGGTSSVATAQLQSLDIGQKNYTDLTVPLLERQHIGADGIVGTDSLQGQRVVLDFVHNTIAIGDAQSLGGSSGYEIVVRARKREGRLILTDALIDGIRADVVIDTGASSTIGNLALQRAIRERSAGQTTLLSVTGHELPAGLGVAKVLRISDVNISNVVIAFADAPAFKELSLRKRPAIFLGMRELRVFKRIAIDFSTRRILFDMPKGS